jgi:antitoxin component of MazEF toxin-antitoxin module
LIIRTLTRQGNSLYLNIERQLRELLEIESDTPLKLSVEGRRLIVEPLSEHERKTRFRKALTDTRREYGTALKNLAK